MPGHKYIKRVMGKNGKWQYVYGNISDSSAAAKSVSKIEKAQNGSESIKSNGWAAKYLANRNKKVSDFTPESITKGKQRASSKVRTSQKWDTKVTRAKIADEPTKEQYKEASDKLEKESKEKIENNEKYYKDLYEQEKESFRTKLTNGLKSKYPNGIPNEEVNKINKQVDQETKTLWKEVYEPLVSKVNDAIKANSDAVLRVLKKKYNQED